MKRRRLNLVLLGAVVALAVAAWFSREKKEPGPPLTAYKPDAVTKIVIEHPKTDAITLERHGAQWAITTPVKADADALEIGALTGLADRETRETLDTAQLKLAELKLDPPDYSIVLNDTRIDFGGTEPLSYRRYVKTGGNVYLIDDPPSAALDADYSDLVAKNLFPEKSVIEKIEVPGLTVAVDAAGNPSATPASPNATPEALKKFADGWIAARSMWNELARDKPPTGDAVKVTMKGGTVYSFVVAAREPQFKLFRPDVGVTFVLSKALADTMLKVPQPSAPAAPAPGTPPGTALPEPAPPKK